MKKLVFVLLLLLAIASCSKEDNKGDILEYVNYSGENEGVRKMLAFKPDGKCMEYFYVKIDGGSIDYEVEYNIDGDNVTLTHATGVYATGKFSNNRNILTMDYGYEDGIWVLNKMN